MSATSALHSGQLGGAAGAPREVSLLMTELQRTSWGSSVQQRRREEDEVPLDSMKSKQRQGVKRGRLRSFLNDAFGSRKERGGAFVMCRV